jgi:hypothetical protein
MLIARTAFVVCLLTAAPGAQGTTIVSTSCSTEFPDGSPTASVTSTTGCTLGVDPLFANPREPFADAQASIGGFVEDGLFGALGSAFTFVFQPTLDPPDFTFEVISAARASAALDLVAVSPGPLRPGLIDLAVQSSGAGGFGGSAGGETGVGTLFASIFDLGNCVGACEGTFPFVLGKPFDIHLSVFSESAASWFEPQSRNLNIQFSFRLLELNGTPVDLQLVAVPEPSTFLLLASLLPLLVLALARRRIVT